jgi:hypothetical protein
MMDAIALLAVREERQDVEAAGDISEVVHHQVGFSQLPDLVLFKGRNGFLRPAEIGTSSGFDLDKDEDILVIGDDVDLSPVEAKPPADDFVLSL